MNKKRKGRSLIVTDELVRKIEENFANAGKSEIVLFLCKMCLSVNFDEENVFVAQCPPVHSQCHQSAFELVWLQPVEPACILASSDFYLSTFLKTQMGGKKFLTDEEVKQEVLMWKKGMMEKFYEDIKNLVLPQPA